MKMSHILATKQTVWFSDMIISQLPLTSVGIENIQTSEIQATCLGALKK